MRIKKVSNTTQTGAQIIDGYSDSRVSGYSCNYINTNYVNNGYTYSTTETLTNKTWIDNRPIYCKVFNIGDVPKETIKKTSYGISNLGQVVDLKGFSDIDDENHTRLNFAVPINFFNIYQHHVGEAENGQHCFVTKTEQAIEFYSTWDVHDLVIIMEYTKTTD